MVNEEIAIPAPPAFLPPQVAEQWKQLYLRGYRESQESQPNIAPDRLADLTHRHAGLREANRLTHIEMPQTYEQALALEDWQLLPGSRKVRMGELIGVTIDGKKFSFTVPE